MTSAEYFGNEKLTGRYEMVADTVGSFVGKRVAIGCWRATGPVVLARCSDTAARSVLVLGIRASSVSEA